MAAKDQQDAVATGRLPSPRERPPRGDSELFWKDFQCFSMIFIRFDHFLALKMGPPLDLDVLGRLEALPAHLRSHFR